MYKLKLVKGLSYAVHTPSGLIIATKDRPEIEVADEIGIGLIEGGNFEAISEDNQPSAEISDDEDAGVEAIFDSSPEPAYSGKTLEQMNMAELETFATYKNVSLKGIRKKNAAIAKLREVLPPEELEGKLAYGSPTIVDLQN